MTMPPIETISKMVDDSFIFRSLDEDIREQLKREATFRRYAPGDLLIREGDEGTEMMIVVEGKVSVSQLSNQGEISLAHLGKNAVIGEVSVITKTRRTSTVTALEEATVLCFSRDIIESITEQSPRVKSLLLRLIEGRAKQSMDMLD